VKYWKELQDAAETLLSAENNLNVVKVQVASSRQILKKFLDANQEQKPEQPLPIASCQYCRILEPTPLLHYAARVYVRCPYCGVSGPSAELENKAVQAWNDLQQVIHTGKGL